MQKAKSLKNTYFLSKKIDRWKKEQINRLKID